jgi:hypothetical protein
MTQSLTYSIFVVFAVVPESRVSQQLAPPLEQILQFEHAGVAAQQLAATYRAWQVMFCLICTHIREILAYTTSILSRSLPSLVSFSIQGT